MSGAAADHDRWDPLGGHLMDATAQATQATQASAAAGTAAGPRLMVELTPLGQLAHDEIAGDMVKELLLRFFGEERASDRWTITARDVPETTAGVLKLLQNDCFRAVADFTGSYFGSFVKLNAGQPHHTPESIQMLLCRVAALGNLGMWDKAARTFDLFGPLDRADLTFDFFPEEYPGKSGPMVPFSFRFFYAVTPAHLGREHQALDRLYALLDSDASHPPKRKRAVRYAIVWCFLRLKEYTLCIETLDGVLQDEPGNVELLQYMGRINVQLGDCHTAWTYFSKAEQLLTPEQADASVAVHANRGILSLALSKYEDAYSHFARALELDPQEASAINNFAVAAVYLGRLDEAVEVISQALQKGGAKGVPDPRLLVNISTMHELESSRSAECKKALIQYVANVPGDSFNVDCLKLL